MLADTIVMSPPTVIALWVTIGIVAALLAYNLVAEMNKSPDDTIGDVIIVVISEHPILVFLGGVVCGHLWWW